VAASHGNIDHEPAVYLIDASGRERTLYLTQMAYASVTQQAALIADGLSRLLPGHPTPHGGVPMTAARSIGPGAVTSLPVIGGDRGAARIPLGRGHPTVVVVDESQTETSPGALPELLARSGGGNLGYPVVADTSGRLADGYGVQDLPWIEVTSPSGQIRYRHDGWLPVASLAHAAASTAAS
jgi:hypothetical protein